MHKNASTKEHRKKRAKEGRKEGRKGKERKGKERKGKERKGKGRKEGRKAVKLKCDVAKLCTDAQRRDHCSYQRKIHWGHWGNSMIILFLVVPSYIAGRRCALPRAPSRFSLLSAFISFISFVH